MKFGVHLPQYGKAAGAEAIRRAAQQSEELGFADVWVSDHLAVPAGAPYPPAFLYEPVVALTWAAAATGRIGLGTSVLVLPYRHPLHLAKELASLDQLSGGGRLTIGVGAGWLEGEFDALNVPFAERGPRTDESLAAMRACWGSQPVTHEGEFFALRDLKVAPQPAGPITIWPGGSAPRALRRATEMGDGWHGTFLSPEETAPIIARLREARPEPEFTISMRVVWDGLTDDAAEIAKQVEAFDAIGVQHLMATPRQADLDGWLRSVEALWTAYSA